MKREKVGQAIEKNENKRKQYEKAQLTDKQKATPNHSMYMVVFIKNYIYVHHMHF